MSNDLSIGYIYDENGNIKIENYKLAYKAGESFRDSYFYRTFYYGDLQSLSNESLTLQNASGYDYARTYYTYDSFYRANEINFTYGDNFTLNTEYFFSEADINGSIQTSTQIKRHISTVNGSATTYYYSYDSKGNIVSVNVDGVQQYRYAYDNLGQLVREDDLSKNQTYVYEYDNNGNITAKKIYPLTAMSQEPSGNYTTVSYGYSNASWGDLLTSFNGKWNEDLNYTSHYHIHYNGVRDDTHIKPGTPVPEPYNSIYFGGLQ